MYYFLYLQNNDRNYNLVKEITETINMYYGKVLNVDDFNTYLVFYVKEHFNKEKIFEHFLNYIADNFLKSLIYISESKLTIDDFKAEIDLVNQLFVSLNNQAKSYVYNYSGLLQESLPYNHSLAVKKLVLKKYYNHSVTYQMLNSFFTNNLNVLKTAKALNLHRNTLIYRLDAFTKATTLDPRVFNEAHLIKLLINI